jgi:putative transposase
MRRGHFTEEQIIGVLKEAEAGKPTKDICREHSITEQTFYRWKAKYGGGFRGAAAQAVGG